eukprot:210506_1
MQKTYTALIILSCLLPISSKRPVEKIVPCIGESPGFIDGSCIGGDRLLLTIEGGESRRYCFHADDETVGHIHFKKKTPEYNTETLHFRVKTNVKDIFTLSNPESHHDIAISPSGVWPKQGIKVIVKNKGKTNIDFEFDCVSVK